MNSIKFTVVIPTRERSDVLIHALRTVLEQDYENYEVIVSDNFSIDNTQEVVENLNNKKIKYINTGKRVGMSQNWEFALNEVQDGWVTIIGDDDGLLPGSLTKASKVIKETGVSALRSKVCSFLWPGVNENTGSRLAVPLHKGLEIRKSKEWIEKVLLGFESYPNLPVLYNGGFVNFEILKHIKERSGLFFNSMNPDVYSGMAIASVINEYAFIKEPLAINGASKHSNGTSAFNSKSYLKGTASDKFATEPNIPFHHSIPATSDGKVVRSLQISSYEAYLQSENLRDSSPLIDHQRQLKVVLRGNEGLFYEEVEVWIRAFAAMHSLDLPSAMRNLRLARIFKKFIHRIKSVSGFINTYVIDDSENQIDNVYDASIESKNIKHIALKRLKNFPLLLFKIKQRVIPSKS